MLWRLKGVQANTSLIQPPTFRKALLCVPRGTAQPVRTTANGTTGKNYTVTRAPVPWAAAAEGEMTDELPAARLPV
ncbi:hypothetical protein SKAU_G00088860 [Synaphobranchus kaupii]|uniref:Uncharacterized protein n=1 Tax=Synaphobranchus kaupii TaxID=118154 RepID=A0A9Q1FW45_SYNKA|nr:hypothetical protein SKAU_G00088860 [Synaphobranchus kaupii]